MPHPEVEALRETSSDDQMKAAISSCIASEVRAGMPQDQATAICHEQVRGKTGGRPAAPGGSV